MPPIPQTLDHETTELIAAINRRKKDLVEFQLPRLRSCKGPLATQQQYAAEIRDDTETLARQIEELDISVEDQNGERNRQLLRQSVQELLQDLATLKKDTRTALLTSKQAIDAQNAYNREELFRSPTAPEKSETSEKVTEDALMRENNNVTEALRRTVGLMQGELERSVLTTQMLDSSTATLRATSSTHDTLDNVLSISKQLVTALEKADRMDKLLIIAGLVFFFLVVLFILKQRVIDRGLRIALFWTRFIPSSSKGSAVADKTERGVLKSTASSVAASVVTTVATALATSLSSVTLTTEVPYETLVTDSENSAVDETIASIITEAEQPLKSTLTERYDEL